MKVLFNFLYKEFKKYLKEIYCFLNKFYLMINFPSKKGLSI